MNKNVIADIKELEVAKNYWISKLAGELQFSELTGGFRAEERSPNGEYEFVLDQCEAADLLRMSKGNDLALYVILVAGCKVLLHQMTDAQDLIVSSPLYITSTKSQISNQVVPLCDAVERGISFKELLLQVRQTVAEAYKYQYYPLEAILKQRRLNEDVLYQMIVGLENIHQAEQLERLAQLPTRNMVFSFVKENEQIRCRVFYNTQKFSSQLVKAFCQSYRQILQQAGADVTVQLDQMELLTKAEVAKLLAFSTTEGEGRGEDLTLNQIFAEQVKMNPERVAVRFKERQVTYGELDGLVNGVASALREEGIQRNQLVGLMVENSVEMVAGILGILRAGGAYLPIDPEYPVERIRFMLTDSQIKLLLTQGELAEKVGFQGELVNFDRLNQETQVVQVEDCNEASDLAYMIYTSGSSGQPKGVLIEHRNVVNLIKWRIQHFGFTPEARTLQLISFSFDGFGTNFYSSLLSGGELCLLDQSQWRDFYDVKEAIFRYKITHMSLVPSMYRAILDEVQGEELQSVRSVVLAGEKSEVDLIQQSQRLYPQILLINEYGPTEACMATTAYKGMTPERVNQIGQPVANSRVYILNQYNQLLPVGFVGELCIAGAGLARGYLNRPELTAEKFVSDPFNPGQRMYRTGDLVRWLEDGTIEYLGRKDYQVKIRGYRIELEEIENQLLQYTKIQQVVVLDREGRGGERELYGYLVSSQYLDLSDLTAFLVERLPGYMIPAHLIQIPEMPLTVNGKIDRKALVENYQALESQAEYVAPRTEIEKKLAGIWEDILQVERVGLNDDFFQLGGHSLRGTKMASRIRKEFNVNLTLNEIFQCLTMKELADFIAGASGAEEVVIEPVAEQEYYPVSSAQKRLYTLYEFDHSNTSYNMPGILVVEGPLDRELLQESFQQLVERHETLRTSFAIVDGAVVQKIHPNVDFQIEFMERESLVTDEAIQEFIRPFDLSQGPLLRVGLIQEKEDQHILIFDMHHIISDGVSLGVLIEELLALYQGQVLSPLPIQYKDYAAWEQNQLKTGKIAEHATYWTELYQGNIPVLDLPTDYSRPAIKSFEGSNIEYLLNPDLTQALHQFALDTGTTLYMVLLAAWNLLLARYSGQEDVIVGSPVAGRPYADLQKLIGLFVNTLPMRNQPIADKSFKMFLHEVKENVLKALDHQQYPFESLLEKLNVKRDMTRNPLFDVVFGVQNLDLPEIQVGELSFSPYQQNEQTAKFDISCLIGQVGDCLQVELEYSTRLFSAERMERMVKHYEKLLNLIIQDPELQIGQLDLLTEEEKQLLLDYNATQIPYPDKLLHQLFIEQVENNSNKAAVIFGETSLTYQELHLRSNQVAHYLYQNGVKPHERVGLLAIRSLDTLVNLLAILKVGGTYVPLEPDYPEERKEYILKNSNCHLVLDPNFYQEKEIQTYPTDDLQIKQDSTSLAYIMYTSGSTGKPKGVAVSHAGAVNTILGSNQRFGIDSEDRFLGISSYCFDLSVYDIFGAWGAGATLYPVQNQRDVAALVESIEEYQITVMVAVPAILKMMVEYVSQEFSSQSVRVVITGGDWIPLQLPDRMMKCFPNVNLFSIGGATESSIWSTYYPVTEVKPEWTSIPYGWPLPNHTMYILDQNLTPTPLGVEGEMYSGGAGVAQSYYFNDQAKTQQAFIEHQEFGRLYRTGDYGIFHKEGYIEFLGRKDFQVKIRGYRIELGEIENTILGHPKIQEAVVMDQTDEKGDRYLVAYIVQVPGEEPIEGAELKEYLAQYIPDYMVPTYIISMEQLPLSYNGKVDRKALLALDHIMPGSSVEYLAPSNVVEEKLIQIWQDILGLDRRIGVLDNFFDLGGHSLNAIRLISMIKSEFDLQMSLIEIFKRPTIKNLADYIFESQGLDVSQIDESLVLLRRGTHPDRHLFFVHAGQGEVNNYMELAKHLDLEFNIWGIRTFRFVKYAPVNLRLEQVAEKYIKMIRKLQPNGPYSIAGWCIGGTISFEMVRQLEAMGQQIEFFALINSMPPQEIWWNHATDFTGIEERDLVLHLLPDCQANHRIKEMIAKEEEIEQIWNLLAENLEELAFDSEEMMALSPAKTENFAQGLDGVRELIFATNILRTYDKAREFYVPDSKIRTQPIFFGANETFIANRELWNLYSEKPLCIYDVDGDHDTIFQSPNVDTFAMVFTEVFTKEMP